MNITFTSQLCSEDVLDYTEWCAKCCSPSGKQLDHEVILVISHVLNLQSLIISEL